MVEKNTRVSKFNLILFHPKNLLSMVDEPSYNMILKEGFFHFIEMVVNNDCRWLLTNLSFLWNWFYNMTECYSLHYFTLLCYLISCSFTYFKCYLKNSVDVIQCSIGPALNVPFFHLHQQTLNIPIYVRTLYATVYFYHYYFILCFTANGSVTKAEFSENRHRLQVAGIVAKGCSSQ